MRLRDPDYRSLLGEVSFMTNSVRPWSGIGDKDGVAVVVQLFRSSRSQTGAENDLRGGFVDTLHHESQSDNIDVMARLQNHKIDIVTRGLTLALPLKQKIMYALANHAVMSDFRTLQRLIFNWDPACYSRPKLDTKQFILQQRSIWMKVWFFELPQAFQD